MLCVSALVTRRSSVEVSRNDNSALALRVRTLLLSIGLLLLISGLGNLQALRFIRTYASYPPDFDEAVHLLPVLQIARDLRSLRLADLASHTYTQDQIAAYPFFHSWLAAPFFLLWKPDIVVARATGLVYLAAATVVVFCLGWRLAARDRWPWLSGLASALLALVCLPLWVYGSVTYLEAPGLCVTFVSLFCYVKADPQAYRPGWAIGASLSAALALFTKYSFGVFVLGGMVLSEAWTVLAEKRLPGGRRMLYLAGPFMLAALAWFAGPGKLDRFWIYSQSQKAAVEFWNAANLLYYPASLVRHYVSGPMALASILAGAALSIWEWRQHRFRAVAAYLLAGMVMLTLIPQKEIRFLYTIGPAAFILAGVGVGRVAARLADLWRQRGPRLRSVLLLLFAGLSVIEVHSITHRFSFFGAALETAYPSSPDTRQAYRFVVAHTLAEGLRPHLLNAWHLFSNYALEWEYYDSTDGEPAAYDYQISAAGSAPEPTPDNLDRWVRRLREEGMSVVVSIDGSPAGSFTGWQVIEPLWTRGAVELITSSPRYTLIEWPDTYVDRVFAGDFAGPAELEAARKESRTEFTIQLHLYALAGP